MSPFMSKKSYFLFLLAIFLFGALAGVLILVLIMEKEISLFHQKAEEIKENIEPAEQEIYIFCHKIQDGIEVDLFRQKLRLCEKGTAVEQFQISTGKRETPTPTGEFRVIHKTPMLFSRIAGAWLPFWVGFYNNYGFHELPINIETNTRIGEDKIGQPASLGCVRLKVNEAEKLYHWAEIGTRVLIFGQTP
ncbi:MAG: L,D-transpeptidase [Candidatus Nealsonbacteria bacterium]|nr:L,D-transpeptidase [Candidatus Nealsonbacteria bacterium]